MQTFFLEGSLWGSAVARAVLAVPCPSPTCSGHARRAALGAHAPRGCCSSVLRGGRGRGCGGARAPARQFHPCLTLKTPPFGHRSGRRVAAEAVRRAPGRSGEQCVMRADALPPWPRTLPCMPSTVCSFPGNRASLQTAAARSHADLSPGCVLFGVHQRDSVTCMQAAAAAEYRQHGVSQRIAALFACNARRLCAGQRSWHPSRRPIAAGHRNAACLLAWPPAATQKRLIRRPCAAAARHSTCGLAAPAAAATCRGLVAAHRTAAARHSQRCQRERTVCTGRCTRAQRPARGGSAHGGVCTVCARGGAGPHACAWRVSCRQRCRSCSRSALPAPSERRTERPTRVSSAGV